MIPQYWNIILSHKFNFYWIYNTTYSDKILLLIFFLQQWISRTATFKPTITTNQQTKILTNVYYFSEMQQKQESLRNQEEKLHTLKQELDHVSLILRR